MGAGMGGTNNGGGGSLAPQLAVSRQPATGGAGTASKPAMSAQGPTGAGAEAAKAPSGYGGANMSPTAIAPPATKLAAPYTTSSPVAAPAPIRPPRAGINTTAQQITASHVDNPASRGKMGQFNNLFNTAGRGAAFGVSGGVSEIPRAF